MSGAITVERDVRVLMRDGVPLATDVYRPAGDGRHPVLVYRTPYSKDDWFMAGIVMFTPFEAVERGYVVVLQDCRGRFKSEGEWRPFFCEGSDGYDCVEWAAAQPWSNGKVGIYGSSYNGVTAIQTLIAAPPHLKACVAYVCGSNYQDSWAYSGGAFELAFSMTWAFFQAWDTLGRLGFDPTHRARVQERFERHAIDPTEGLRRLPLRDHPLFRDGVAPYFEEWLEHPRYDDYWAKVDAAARASEIRVPVLHITCWYDALLKGHLALNEALKAHPDPRVRDTHEFLIGPWDHMSYVGVQRSAAGDREFGPTAISGPATVAPLAFEWFDRWLFDKQTAPVQRRARYFMMGVNEWREAETWPPLHVLRKHYLRSGGRANTRFGDGRLAPHPPAVEPPDSYLYDPDHPAPTVGGRTMAPGYCTTGVQDQAAVEEREDVLVYTSDHLATPLAIAGPVAVTLFASSSAPDTDFTAKLVDVEPSGYCANIAEGILRARYRSGLDREELLSPGVVVELEIDLLDVAHVFQPGHRIRLEISSSCFPKYDRNVNSAVAPGSARPEDVHKAVQHVYHDATHVSCLELPVVDPS